MTMFKAHEKFIHAIGHHETSPAALAYSLIRETRYTNERMLQYITSYINTMATSKVIPEHLEEIREVCVHLNASLQELGLTGSFKYMK